MPTYITREEAEAQIDAVGQMLGRPLKLPKEAADTTTDGRRVDAEKLQAFLADAARIASNPGAMRATRDVEALQETTASYQAAKARGMSVADWAAIAIPLAPLAIAGGAVVGGTAAGAAVATAAGAHPIAATGVALGVGAVGFAGVRSRKAKAEAERKAAEQAQIDEVEGDNQTVTYGQIRQAAANGSIDDLLAGALNGETTGVTLTDRDIELAARRLGGDLPWTNTGFLDATFGPESMDRANLFWESGSMRPESVDAQGPLRGASASSSTTAAEQRLRVINAKRQGSKAYSLREALAKPYSMKDDELQALAEKFWTAGYMNIDGYDISKPFDDQYRASAYDPAFQQAYQRWVSESFTDRSKSAMAILEDRMAKRRPILDRLTREAVQEKVDRALARVNITDPARLRQMAQTIAQQELGRGLTVASQQALAEWYSSQEQAQVMKAVAGEATVDLDPDARLTEKVRADNAVEAEALDTAEAFSMFRSLLGPGGLS